MTFALDPRTLIVACLVSASLFGVISIGFARLHDSTRFVGAWGRAMLVIGAGLLGLALRDPIPFWLSAIVGNTLIVAGIALAMRALRVFVGSKPRDGQMWGLLALLVVLLVYFTELRPSHVGRTIVISAAFFVIALRAALLLRRAAPVDCRLSSRVTEYVFWSMAWIAAFRVVGMLVFPPPDFLAPDAFNSAVFLFYLSFIIVSSLSVMWMEIESLQAELVRSARTDSLTGLSNRATFLADFEREVSRCQRGAPAFSIAMFDLDRFKRLNDEHGHPFGDRVLKTFASALQASIRKHDTVGRYGGEEFALLMPGTGRDTALRVAERVRRDLESRGLTVDGQRVEVTVSGGVATFGLDGEDWESLLAAADAALYKAKDAGRNRIVSAGKPDTA